MVRNVEIHGDAIAEYYIHNYSRLTGAIIRFAREKL
jgi:hypothetical protein